MGSLGEEAKLPEPPRLEPSRKVASGEVSEPPLPPRESMGPGEICLRSRAPAATLLAATSPTINGSNEKSAERCVDGSILTVDGSGMESRGMKEPDEFVHADDALLVIHFAMRLRRK